MRLFTFPDDEGRTDKRIVIFEDRKQLGRSFWTDGEISAPDLWSMKEMEWLKAKPITMRQAKKLIPNIQAMIESTPK